MTAEELKSRLQTAGIRVTIAGYVRESDSALALGIAPRTLQRWRECGTAPRSMRLGRRHLYSVESLADFITTSNDTA